MNRPGNNVSVVSRSVHTQGPFTGEQAEQLLLPIISDQEMPAQDKLLRVFAVLNQYKQANLDLVFAFMRVWYADENALFRQQLYLARVKRLTPLLPQIIRQGVKEDVFTTPYPDQAARTILALLEDLGYATVELLLVEGEHPDLSRLVQMGEATAEALERVLGMPPGGCGRVSANISLAGRLSSHEESVGWNQMRMNTFTMVSSRCF